MKAHGFGAATTVALLLVNSASADPLRSVTQSILVESGRTPAAAVGAADAPARLLVGRHLRFQPFDAALGALDHVTLTIEGEVEHAYVVSVSDDLPGDEAPERVALAVALSTDLHLDFDGIGWSLRRPQPGAAVACAGLGSCVLRHRESFAVDERVVLPHRRRRPDGARWRPTGFLRLRAAAPVAAQLCPEHGAFETCTIRRADVRIGGGGLRVALTYWYRPTAAAAPAGPGVGAPLIAFACGAGFAALVVLGCLVGRTGRRGEEARPAAHGRRRGAGKGATRGDPERMRAELALRNGLG